MNILCICTHNYFRSQLTEHLLRAMGYEDVRSRSTASAYLLEGMPEKAGHPLVLAAIKRHGGQCDGYTVQNMTFEDIDWADVILCAEEEHSEAIWVTNQTTEKILVMNVPDGGVDNAEAVETAACQIEEFLHKWKS